METLSVSWFVLVFQASKQQHEFISAWDLDIHLKWKSIFLVFWNRIAKAPSGGDSELAASVAHSSVP